MAIAISLSSLTVFSAPTAKAAACTPETTTSGIYTIVAFKTVGTCTWSTPTGTNVFRGLIVAGGGGGGYDMGGGGGGGGYVEFESLTVTNDVLSITVGAGGLGATSNAITGAGGNSQITGSGINLISRGGAGGGTWYNGGYPATSNGGSGGGEAGAAAYSSDNSLGTQTSQAQTPALSTIYGAQFGGNGSPGGSPWYPGGGGGAGGDGSNTPGNGGIGKVNNILGTSYYWAGGGGGSGYSGAAGNGGAGGGGGGGAGEHTSVAVGLGGSGLNSGANGVSPTGTGGNGGTNTGGGGGAGTHSYNAGGNGGSGIVVLRYLTFAGPATFASATSSSTNTVSPITFSITFAQSVDSVAASDFTNVGTATGCSFAINAASGTSFTLTVSSCSEGTLVPQITAGSMRSVSSGANGPTSNIQTTTPIRIDRTNPAISSVSAPLSNTYRPSETPTFTVNFSESMTVTGTPRLSLTVGASTKYANFLTFTDSKTALFRYTIGTAADEWDADGISVLTNIDLNGGSITDLATNALTSTAFSAPTLSNVKVAQPPAAPTIDSISASNVTLNVYFTAGSDRGWGINTYQYSTDNGATWRNRSSGTTASPIPITQLSASVTNLTNGVGYPIRIRAVNGAGNGESSTAVTETPTSIIVTGDSTLSLSYGSSASTGTYSANGGTNTFTWSLGSSISGVTLSGTTVTAGNTLAAGTYTQTVRATDGNSLMGSKTLTITVSKATTSISIALPNSASTAALGGAITITATVPRAGAVNFKLGGVTISGCGSASATTTTATCSWTPASLGSVSLTADFSPTDSSNFETSTSTTLSITVVNGVSSITLQLAGGVIEVPKGQTINIIAAIDQAGKVSFFIDGKRIAGCFNRTYSAGNATCAWKPAVQKQVSIRATLNPTNSVYNNSSSTLNVWVKRRVGLR